MEETVNSLPKTEQAPGLELGLLPAPEQTIALELGPWQLLAQCPDPNMDNVKTLVEKSAVHEIPTIITGETGVGKELVAGAIHQLSRRNGRRLEILDCTNLNPNLMGSELFGHERGSFTGALQQHIGQFELADQGTILLDEIGELPLELQVRMLRVLESGSFKRVGGKELVRSDFRVIAATNRNLGEMVKKGTFREDLFYRLDIFPINVPPLRQRPLDITHLAESFARKFQNGGKTQVGFTPESETWLRRQPWPGNVRQLRHAVERAMILVNGDGAIMPHHLDIGQNHRRLSAEIDGLTAERLIPLIIKFTGKVPWPDFVCQIERAMISLELEMGHSPKQIAKNLGYPVKNLKLLVKNLGYPIHSIGAKYKLLGSGV